MYQHHVSRYTNNKNYSCENSEKYSNHKGCGSQIVAWYNITVPLFALI